jgi:stage III sporulation protein AF
LKSDPVGELKRAMTAMDSPSDGNATLEQILAHGRRLQSNEQEQSLQWTAKELANVMKGQIEETTGERVQSVEVKLAMDTTKPETDLASSVELPVIQYVLVEMTGEAAAGKVNSNTAQQEATETTKPIFDSDPESEDTESPPVKEPIEIGQIEVPDVQIEVNSGSNQKGQEDGSTPVSGEQTETNSQQGQTSSRSERAVQIITLLTGKWDIDANKVQVKEKKNASAL